MVDWLNPNITLWGFGVSRGDLKQDADWLSVMALFPSKMVDITRYPDDVPSPGYKWVYH